MGRSLTARIVRSSAAFREDQNESHLIRTRETIASALRIEHDFPASVVGKRQGNRGHHLE
jgi:hypothetical protein